MRRYEEGESQRFARRKLGLFLDAMGFPAQKFQFQGSKFDSEELKIANINEYIFWTSNYEWIMSILKENLTLRNHSLIQYLILQLLSLVLKTLAV